MICAGYVDSYKGNHDSVLAFRVDSGGGLLVAQMLAGEQRYFLQGVVSNSRRTNTCDRSFYTLFTNVQFYKDFLNEAFEEVSGRLND